MQPRRYIRRGAIGRRAPTVKICLSAAGIRPTWNGISRAVRYFHLMPIRYPVGPGAIVLCDYSLGGFREPEMVKRRPSVVVSPRLPHRDGLCSVVPLSGTAPIRDVGYVVRIELPAALPAPFEQRVWWAR